MRSHTVFSGKIRRVSSPAVLVVLASAAGLAAGAGGDDDPPIQQIMGQVHARSRAIARRLRAPGALGADDRKGMAEDAAVLGRLVTEARGLTEPARERKTPQRDWARAADDLLRAADDFARVIADPRSDRPRAARSFQALQKTCTNCHRTFRG
jgi:hypothetical protein